MDIGCGDSWYVLGNAYVASFFRSSRGIRDLDRALQAYKKAVRSGLAYFLLIVVGVLLSASRGSCSVVRN